MHCVDHMHNFLELLFLDYVTVLILLIYSVENLKIQDYCNINILPLLDFWRPMYLNKIHEL